MAYTNQHKDACGQATLKNFRTSPRKARQVVNMIRGKGLEAAVNSLSFCDRKTAPALKKLLFSAASNAETKSGVDVDELIVKAVWVDEGRKLKRFMPRAQGRATPIMKRSSNITVVLDRR